MSDFNYVSYLMETKQLRIFFLILFVDIEWNTDKVLRTFIVEMQMHCFVLCDEKSKGIPLNVSLHVINSV